MQVTIKDSKLISRTPRRACKMTDSELPEMMYDLWWLSNTGPRGIQRPTAMSREQCS